MVSIGLFMFIENKRYCSDFKDLRFLHFLLASIQFGLLKNCAGIVLYNF